MHILRYFFKTSHNTPPPKTTAVNRELLATVQSDIARAEYFLNHVNKSPSNPNFCDTVCAVHSLRLARVTLELLGGREQKANG